jgi:putative transposase
MDLGFKSNVTEGIGFKRLHTLIHLWLLDYYAQKFNKEIGGIPSNVWNDAEKDGRLVPLLPCSELYELLPKGTMNIQLTGIRFLRLFYLSEELMKLRNKLNEYKYQNKIVFRYNPEDLSVIFVYDEFQHKYITVPCSNQEYANDLHEVVQRKLINKYMETDAKAFSEFKPS